MKKGNGQRDIVFFTAEDNARAKTKKKSKKAEKALRSSVSATGRLVFSAGVIEAMGVEPTASFRIGKENSRGGLKSLFLFPATGEESDSFTLTKTGSTYGLNLGGIFRSQKVDYKTSRYTFSVGPYEEGEGFELTLLDRSPRSKRGGDSEEE